LPVYFLKIDSSAELIYSKAHSIKRTLWL